VLKKQQQNSTNRNKESSETYLSDPIEISGERFSFTPDFIDMNQANYQQPWNGFAPACTLENQNDSEALPLQKANIKIKGLYKGIQVAGDKWMHMACAEAKKSVENHGGPFGAVLLQIDVESSQIVRYWVNHNKVTSIHDPTAHAEVMAIRSACHCLGVFNLGHIAKKESLLPQPGAISYCVIYSSAEPCPMCYSAICWANISTLFFAATRSDSSVEGVNFSDEKIYNELSKPYSERTLKAYQCTTDNSLDAFNLWKRSPKTPY
jgi:guanine deaminase